MKKESKPSGTKFSLNNPPTLKLIKNNFSSPPTNYPKHSKNIPNSRKSIIPSKRNSPSTNFTNNKTNKEFYTKTTKTKKP
jgi:hypothetical protein